MDAGKGENETPSKTQHDVNDDVTVDTFLDVIIQYKLCDREFIVSKARVVQELYTRLYQAGLSDNQYLLTGARYGGIPREACLDPGVLVVNKTYPIVITTPPLRSVKYRAGFVLSHAEQDHAAFLQLKVTNQEGISQEVKEVMTSGGFISSTAVVEAARAEGAAFHHGLPGGGTINGAAGVTTPGGGGGYQGTRRGSKCPALTESSTEDKILCFSCPSWPPCASEFLSRARGSATEGDKGWPGQGVCERIRGSGCHVVPAVHPESIGEQKETEWRWSFSAAEKELLQDGTSAMAGAYYLLKSVQRGTFRPDLTGLVTDYTLKTSCLWACEKKRYPESNSMAVSKDAINWLIQGYKGRSLPHFFIPKQNLIGHLSEDECNKAVDWLEEVSADLHVHALSSIQIDAELDTVLQNMCLELGVATSDRDDGYKELVKALNGGQGIEVMQKAMSLLAVGSEVYQMRQKKSISRSGRKYHVNYMFNHVLEKLLKQENIPADKVLSVPDYTVQRIQEKLDELTLGGYKDTFINSLTRDVGEWYLALAEHYKSDSDVTKKCLDKAANYFTIAGELSLPWGFSDHKILSYVLLCKMYYLQEQWEKLDETMSSLAPLLDEVRTSNEYVTLLPSYVTDKNSDLMLNIWKRDAEFHQQMSLWPDECFPQHPVAIGYYIKGRRAVAKGNKNEVQECLRDMKELLDTCKREEMIHSTNLIISALEKAASH